MNKFYTGIGSRSTPNHIKKLMSEVSFALANSWVLRSGKAKGADEAFQLGVQSRGWGQGYVAEIYTPWKDFKGGEGLWDCWDQVPNNWEECYKTAASIHPAWDKCSQGAKKLHGRNVCQLLGNELPLVEPSAFVLYWAEEDRQGNPKGGTRTAVMLAKEYDIPTINMLHSDWEEHLKEVIKFYDWHTRR